jgi:cation diffusion facilitator CzcD-associated flavoprotein CzcO
MIPAFTDQPLDVLVVGGGQAGLALGFHLFTETRAVEFIA